MFDNIKHYMLEDIKQYVLSFLLDVIKTVFLMLFGMFVLLFLTFSMCVCIVMHVYQAVAMKFQRY